VLLTVWVSAVVLLVAERDHKESREEEVIWNASFQNLKHQ
jgi:hypothetical protein